MSWPEAESGAPISFDAGQPVVMSLSGRPFLTEFHADGSSAPIAIQAAPGIAATLGNGFAFIAVAAQTDAPEAVWRTDPEGKTVNIGSLPPPGALSPYEQISGSSDGQWVALEKGDHTDVCGVGPTSSLYLMNAATGAVSTPNLPESPGAIWRFGAIKFSPDSILDVSAYQVRICSGNGTIRFQSLLFELSHGRFQVVARDVVDGQRGPHGQLAVITGDRAFRTVGTDLPDLTTVGKKSLKVDGREVRLAATPTFLTWAPQNP
jgi:hypothetical protein